MACDLWGDGSFWGDGSLWCRAFGSSQYTLSDAASVSDVEAQLHRGSIQVVYSASNLFVVDRIMPNIDWGRSQQDYTYEAQVDISSIHRVSVQLAFSSDVLFVVRDIIPHVQLKQHIPVG